MATNTPEANLASIKKLLVFMAIPLAIYIMKLLSFIFIPLLSAIFLALLFMPTMRWMARKGVPKWLNTTTAVIILLVAIRVLVWLITLSSREILGVDEQFWADLQVRLDGLISAVQNSLGVPADKQGLDALLKGGQLSSMISSKVGGILKYLNSTLTMSLMTLFFLVLLLAESLDIQKIMSQTIFKRKYLLSVKYYSQIEQSIVRFIKVKFLLSFFTGLGFSLACLYFDVGFPFFWGFFTFGINFVQMIGSIISVILVSLFALAQMEPSGTLALFVLSLISVQVLFGSILEPIFMGKSFSMSTITVLVMLMFWGFIWGIPGLILSIPITVALKKILELFPNTKVIAKIMS